MQRFAGTEQRPLELRCHTSDQPEVRRKRGRKTYSLRRGWILVTTIESQFHWMEGSITSGGSFGSPWLPVLSIAAAMLRACAPPAWWPDMGRRTNWPNRSTKSHRSSCIKLFMRITRSPVPNTKLLSVTSYFALCVYLCAGMHRWTCDKVYSWVERRRRFRPRISVLVIQNHLLEEIDLKIYSNKLIFNLVWIKCMEDGSIRRWEIYKKWDLL